MGRHIRQVLLLAFMATVALQSTAYSKLPEPLPFPNYLLGDDQKPAKLPPHRAAPKTKAAQPIGEYQPIEPHLPTIDQPLPKGNPLSEKPKMITLDEAILLALRNNPDIRNARLDRVVQKFALEVARNEFEPQYTLTANAQAGNGQEPTYGVQSNMSIKTPIGTQISVGLDQNVGMGSQTSANVNIMQPLIRGFGSEVTLAPWRDAVDQEQVQRLDFKQRIMDTIASVIQDYYAVVEAYNNLETTENALKDSVKTLEQTEIKIKLGRVAPADLTQQQSRVAEQKLGVIEAKNEIEQSYQSLLSVLGLSPASKLTVDKKINIGKIIVPDLKQSTKTAIEYNTNYRSALINIQGTQRAVITAKDAQKWQLNLELDADKILKQSDDFSGGVTPDIPTGAGGNGFAGTNGSSGLTSSNTTVSLDLSVPIDDMAAKQQLVDARIAMQQALISLSQTKRDLKIQVIQEIQNLLSQKLQIEQAEKAIELAEKSLENERRKYNFGRATLIDVNTLQTSLIAQQLSLTRDKIEYINTRVRFEVLLGVLLDRWHIKLQY